MTAKSKLEFQNIVKLAKDFYENIPDDPRRVSMDHRNIIYVNCGNCNYTYATMTYFPTPRKLYIETDKKDSEIEFEKILAPTGIETILFSIKEEEHDPNKCKPIKSVFGRITDSLHDAIFKLYKMKGIYF